MKFSLHFSTLFITFCLYIVVDARNRRGLGNFLKSKFGKKESGEESKKDIYDPKTRLYADFLKSPFVNVSLPTQSNDTEKEDSVRGKGILEMFKSQTTIDPNEKRFQMYLTWLDKNMTLTKNKTSMLVHTTSMPIEEEKDEVVEIKCSIKPNIDNVPLQSLSENEELDGWNNSIKEHVNRPVEAADVMTSKISEEVTSVRYHEENVARTTSEGGHVTSRPRVHLGRRKMYKGKKVGHKLKNVAPPKEEESRQNEEGPDEIKYLFPEQL